MQNVGIWDAFRSVRLSDFKEVHKKPCVRESFLVGIGAGFGVGGFRAILGGERDRTTTSELSDLHSVGPCGL